MGNNKSFLLNFQQQKQAECPSDLVEIKMGAVSSTSSLPVGLNVNTFSSSPASANGFLKRIRHHANYNKLKSKKKISSLERLNEPQLSVKDCNRVNNNKNNKKRKFLVFNEKKPPTPTKTRFTDNDQIAQLITSSKQTTNDIIIEPEYTSISDCHSAVQHNLITNNNSNNNNMAIEVKPNFKKVNSVEESFYESTLEIYELTVAKEKKFKNKNQHLDFNLYSEVATKTNETTTPHSILVISNALHINKYYLNNFFNRIKNTKNMINRNKRTAHLPPAPPQLPSKAFNPAKEFIYEQTKYANSLKDNESNIYFKIGKFTGGGGEEEDDLQDEKDSSIKKPPPIPLPSLPKQVKTQENCKTVAECDDLKHSNPIMSSSASSESSSSSSSSQFERSFSFEDKLLQAPPLPPLPDKSTLPYTPIESFNLNNHVYYSFIGNTSTRYLNF